MSTASPHTEPHLFIQKYPHALCTVQISLSKKMNISQAVPLFSILRLSFEEVFWTFLITHGEIKVIAALYTAKEAGGELYRPL